MRALWISRAREPSIFCWPRVRHPAFVVLPLVFLLAEWDLLGLPDAVLLAGLWPLLGALDLWEVDLDDLEDEDGRFAVFLVVEDCAQAARFSSSPRQLSSTIVLVRPALIPKTDTS